jgi:hypothetical protein
VLVDKLLNAIHHFFEVIQITVLINVKPIAITECQICRKASVKKEYLLLKNPVPH